MTELKSLLALARCPHCGTDRPTLSEKVKFESRSYDGSAHRYWKCYVCSRCGGAVLAATISNWEAPMRECYPEPAVVATELPSRAREYLQQARDSLSAPAGAVMLAASSIDAMLKEKGYVEGSLYSRIDKAAEDNLITQGMAKWAHEVRLDANDQRHADQSAPLPTTEAARRVIDFAEAIGDFLFVVPARVKRGIEAVQND